MCSKPRRESGAENARAVNAGASRMRGGAAGAHRHVSGKLEGRIPSRDPASGAALSRRSEPGSPGSRRFRGGRDRTHARARWAPRPCSRSSVAFSRRTSRKGSANKPQTNSCQLLRPSSSERLATRRADVKAGAGSPSRRCSGPSSCCDHLPVGTSATARSGPPDPPPIFIGSAMTHAPTSGT